MKKAIPSLDRPFNPYRRARSDAAKGLVEDVLNQLQGLEKHRKLRSRARRLKDQEIFEQQVEAIVSDLTHRYLSMPEGRLAIPRSKQILGNNDPYRSELLNKTFPDVVDRLGMPDLAFLELEIGSHATKRQSTIKVGKRLSVRIQSLNLSLHDFKLDKSTETIILRRSKLPGERKGKSIPYKDTEVTQRYRAELETINNRLIKANISYHGKDRLVDTSFRYLRRIFNKSNFGMGGRLYGGFWQGLEPEERAQITIDDEQVCCLDYGQMSIHIAYSLCRATPCFEDGYAIPGIKGDRAMIKKFVIKLLNCKTSNKKLPKGVRLERPDIPWSRLAQESALPKGPAQTREMLADGVEAKYAEELIIDFHSPIRDLFYHENSLKFMFLDSELMVELLLELGKKGIVALPIHDALLVKSTDATITTRIMKQVAQKHLGLDIPVSMDGN